MMRRYKMNSTLQPDVIEKRGISPRKKVTQIFKL